MNRTIFTILVMLLAATSIVGYSDEGASSSKLKSFSIPKTAVAQPQTGSPNADLPGEARAKLPVYPSKVPLEIIDHEREKIVKPLSAFEKAQRLVIDPTTRAIMLRRYRQGSKGVRLDVDHLPMTEVSRDIAIDHPYKERYDLMFDVK